MPSRKELDLERHQMVKDISDKLDVVLKRLDEIEEKCACFGNPKNATKKWEGKKQENYAGYPSLILVQIGSMRPGNSPVDALYTSLTPKVKLN